MKTAYIALAGLAVGGLFLATRQAQAAQPGTARATLPLRRPINTVGQAGQVATYVNPQALRETQLVNTVAQVFGILTQPSRVVSTPVRPVIDTADARRDARAADLGYYGWTGPTVTPVDPAVSAQYSQDPYFGGSSIADSIPAGPVYDVGQDASPYAWADPDYFGLGQ